MFANNERSASWSKSEVKERKRKEKRATSPNQLVLWQIKLREEGKIKERAGATSTRASQQKEEKKKGKARSQLLVPCGSQIQIEGESHESATGSEDSDFNLA